MSHKIRKYVHPKRDQLELLVFFVSFSSTFISPCSFVQLHPSSMPATRAQATNERTDEHGERAQRRRRRNRRYPRLSAPPFASSLERAIGRARSDGEGKNRLSTGPRFVESHLANSVNVVRRRRRRSLLCPTRSSIAVARQASKHARFGVGERTAERRPDDGSSRQLLSGEATSNLTRGRARERESVASALHDMDKQPPPAAVDAVAADTHSWSGRVAGAARSAASRGAGPRGTGGRGLVRAAAASAATGRQMNGKEEGRGGRGTRRLACKTSPCPDKPRRERDPSVRPASALGWSRPPLPSSASILRALSPSVPGRRARRIAGAIAAAAAVLPGAAAVCKWACLTLSNICSTTLG